MVFFRMRRSTSQEVVGGDKPFKRGGVRATAGPRLGGGSHANNNRSKPAKSDSFLSPFRDWTSEQVSVIKQNLSFKLKNPTLTGLIEFEFFLVRYLLLVLTSLVGNLKC